MTERIALAVIAGDDAIEEGILRMLDSAKDQVHGAFVAFNGKDRWGVSDKIYDKVCENWGEGNVAERPWYDDFARSRNDSFELVREHMRLHPAESGQFDWIFWMDCDDILPAEGIGLQGVIAELRKRRAHGAHLDYQYQWDDEHEMALATHYKERLFRADINWQWVWPIHENCVGPISTRMMKVEGQSVRHLRGEVAPKRERNKRLVKLWYDTEKNTEPRAIMYMAHETFALAVENAGKPDQPLLLGAALKLYREFIDRVGWGDDAYACNHQSAEILRMLGRWQDALNLELQGIKMEPSWPQSYTGLAMTHVLAGNDEEAIIWARIARKVASDPIDTLHAIDHLESTYKPFMIEGDAQMKLGNPIDAEVCFEKALGYFDDEFTRERLRVAVQASKMMLAEERRLARNGPTVPNRELLWGSRPEKSIAFFVPGGAEDWNPTVLAESGLGGTETCIIKLTERLADNGWRVVIFGRPGDEFEDRVSYSATNPDGRIEWYRYGQYHPDEEFTVFVVLRSPDVVDGPINAKVKILWLHDVSMGPVRKSPYGDRFSKVDRIVCPSQWHAQHIHDVYRFDTDPPTADLNVIHNGFEWEKFISDGRSRRVGKIIYASSPDRGLPRLLELWPAIAQKVPDANLHVFYGWEGINAMIEAETPNAGMLRQFKARTEKQFAELKAAGHDITWHGRVDQNTLARHMFDSLVMAYPADFMETFGIVFAQAMTAGVIPVVPNLGNLPDLVHYDGIIVPGPPNSMEFAPRFVEAVRRAALEAPNTVRESMSVSTTWFKWDQIVSRWETMITEELIAQEAAVAS